MLGIHRRSSQRMSSVSMTSTLGCVREVCATARGAAGCGVPFVEPAVACFAVSSRCTVPQPTATDPISAARASVGMTDRERVREIMGPGSRCEVGRRFGD